MLTAKEIQTLLQLLEDTYGNTLSWDGTPNLYRLREKLIELKEEAEEGIGDNF